MIKNNPFRMYEFKGKTYVDGLFKAMDEQGFPLADSLVLCKEKGLIPCLQQFVMEAILKGWGNIEGQPDQSKIKAIQRIKEAICDSGFDIRELHPKTINYLELQ